MDALGSEPPKKWRNVWKFTSKDGQWRWQVTDADNGKIIGASTEAYHNLSDCEANALRLGWDGVDGKQARPGRAYPVPPTK